MGAEVTGAAVTGRGLGFKVGGMVFGTGGGVGGKVAGNGVGGKVTGNGLGLGEPETVGGFDVGCPIAEDGGPMTSVVNSTPITKAVARASSTEQITWLLRFEQSTPQLILARCDRLSSVGISTSPFSCSCVASGSTIGAIV